MRIREVISAYRRRGDEGGAQFGIETADPDVMGRYDGLLFAGVFLTAITVPVLLSTYKII